MRLWQNFWDCSRGVAAIEFALILPLLITLSLGGFEISRLLLIHQKADRIAYTVTDVVTQSTSLSQAQLDEILTVAAQIMNPQPFAQDGTIILSSVYKQGTNQPTIRWQYQGGGNLARSSAIGNTGNQANLNPPITLEDKDNIIISEVYFEYQPLFTLGFFAPMEIYKTVIFKPRLGVLTTPPV